MSMFSFLTNTSPSDSGDYGSRSSEVTTTRLSATTLPLTSKRDYSNDKHVCMLCVYDSNLKDKQIAILCRGTLHQLRRHYERRHADKNVNYGKLVLKEQFKDVLPINHARVPRFIRTLSKSNHSSKTPSKEKQSPPAATISSHHQQPSVHHHAGLALPRPRRVCNCLILSRKRTRAKRRRGKAGAAPGRKRMQDGGM